MGKGKHILVIPSIREDRFNDFMQAWEKTGDWDEVILIEDNPYKSFVINLNHHYSWKEIEESLGDNSWVISRKDSAIRSFGFLVAQKLGAEYVLTLDDDCYPHDDRPIFQTHIEKMKFSKWTESVPFMRTRGLPYKNLGTLVNIVANVGLWSKIPDLDSIQSLNDLDFATNGNFQPPLGNRIIPTGQYFPDCGMNYCFRADVIPLSYFPLMGEDSPYCRFDDIWHGVIFKKIIDHLGWYVSVGEPFIAHQRASDVMVNLIKEAPGIRANETFWEKIDGTRLISQTPKDCMREIGETIKYDSDNYVAKLGTAIQVWVELIEQWIP
jgi:reversibly glycosylated polypeptide/UDP-arabinopyranose mutase